MALLKRVIICLDVRAGKVTKGIKFKGNVDLGDPVEYAARYDQQGVDELAPRHHRLSRTTQLLSMSSARRRDHHHPIFSGWYR